MLRTLLITGAASIVIAACTANSGTAASDGPQPSVAPSGPTAAPVGSGDGGGDGGATLPADITGPILADAAGRLGVDPSAVTIVDARKETWSDGSLGCPQPGMMYTQALVEGYQVIVEANGTQLDYRGGGPGQFQLCEKP